VRAVVAVGGPEGRTYVPVDMTQSPSSETLTRTEALSKWKSCSSSTRFWYSMSSFRLRFRRRASQSGRFLPAPPETVYTDTASGLESFILAVLALQTG
jgi:hypothetical protein